MGNGYKAGWAIGLAASWALSTAAAHAGIDGTVFSHGGKRYFVYSPYIGPDSAPHIQRFDWSPAGWPQFGKPVPGKTPLPVPSGTR